MQEDYLNKLNKIKMQITIDKHPGSICVVNYKGGVGKTTVSTLLGYYLANKGNKVLLIDIDPQCSLSLAVGFEPEVVNKTDYTIYHLVTPNKWNKIPNVKFNTYIDEIPEQFAPHTLKIIKGSFDVDELDIVITTKIVEQPNADEMLFNYCRNMLNAFEEYDYIIIDSPPNKMYLTQAMLRASAYFVAVTIPDLISIYGMPRLLKWVKKIPKDEKPKLLGCILNGVVRAGGNEFGTTNQQQAIVELIERIKSELAGIEKEILGNKPILGRIPRLDSISKFLSQRGKKTAWFDLKQTHSMQQSVNSIMLNLLNRIEKRIEEYAKS